MKRPGKTLFALIILYGIIPFSVCLYMLSFNIINILDESSYIRYATNGKYNEDVFFKGALKMDVDLNPMLEELVKVKVKRPQELFKEILKDEYLFRQKVSLNHDYLTYLDKNNLTVNDVVAYMNKISELDNLMLVASLYIVALIYIIIYYFGFKYRKRIYLGAGILYFMLMLDSFSSGLISNALYPHVKKWFEGDYENYVLMSKGMLPAIKEATLTFLYFDTVIQFYVDKRNKSIASELRYTFNYLESFLNLLKKVENNPTVKISKVKNLPHSLTLNKFCKKNKQDRYLSKVRREIEQIKYSELSQLNTTQIFEKYDAIMENLKKSKIFMETIS